MAGDEDVQVVCVRKQVHPIIIDLVSSDEDEGSTNKHVSGTMSVICLFRMPFLYANASKVIMQVKYAITIWCLYSIGVW